MAYFVDSLMDTKVNIDDKWYVARPYPHFPFLWRIKDAWRVLTGKCDAVYFKEKTK